jgi:hypothetical protein
MSSSLGRDGPRGGSEMTVEVAATDSPKSPGREGSGPVVWRTVLDRAPHRCLIPRGASVSAGTLRPRTLVQPSPSAEADGASSTASSARSAPKRTTSSATRPVSSSATATAAWVASSSRSLVLEPEMTVDVCSDAELSGSGGGAFGVRPWGVPRAVQWLRRTAVTRSPTSLQRRPRRRTGRPSRVRTRDTSLLGGCLRAPFVGRLESRRLPFVAGRRSFGRLRRSSRAVVAEPATASNKPLSARLSGSTAAPTTRSTEPTDPPNHPPDEPRKAKPRTASGHRCAKGATRPAGFRGTPVRSTRAGGGAIPMPAPPGNRLPTPARPSMRRCLRRRPRASLGAS